MSVAGADLAQHVVLVQVLTPGVRDLLIGACWRSSGVDFEQVATLGAVALFHILVHGVSPGAGEEIREQEEKHWKHWQMDMTGLHFYRAFFVTSGPSKRFTILPNVHPFMHTPTAAMQGD